MRILHTFPPNYAAINKVFKIRGKPVIFTYGDVIHNPARIDIPPQIEAHESVHMAQQGEDPGRWWERYIEDSVFRLAQEIPAHRAEYACLCNRQQASVQTLRTIAQRLASPLYGSIIGLAEAEAAIGP